MHMFSAIGSFVGLLTWFEWIFRLYYEIWRHIWRQNKSYPSISQNIIILTPPSRSSGEICTHTNFQLNSIIFWHSNIICMTFWTILWYLTSYLTSKCHLTPSKSQKVKILTPKSAVHPKKLTYTHSETNTVILLRFLAF